MCNVAKHAGGRFATGAAIIRAVRANKDGVDKATQQGQFPAHLGMDGIERGHGKQTTRQTGLVGGNDHLPAVFGQRAKASRLPGMASHSCGLFKGIAVMVDDTVPINDGKFH
uniref:Uncharacterized protein n=1 Tax=Panagrolaimus superbus TaxID=310955 RepID=A0A914YBR8_9BILA